ncbi:MAG: glycosyltransferase [Cyclobacteriaceae bacterium]|nr:glycosyltransferase [Cyclobacteriaceae bacterium]
MSSARKKRILVYVDSPGWAYDNLARHIRAAFAKDFDWYVDYTFCHRFLSRPSFIERVKTDLLNLFRFVYRLVLFRPFAQLSCWTLFGHKLTFFWQRKFEVNGTLFSRRVLPFWMKYDLVIQLDYYFDRHAKLVFRSHRLVKGIYFDGFPPVGCNFDYIRKINPQEIKSISYFVDEYLSYTDAVLCGSPSISRRFTELGLKTFFCTAIRDEHIFEGRDVRLKPMSETLIIGWTGNPRRAFKHFDTIIRPVILKLRKSGLDIELKTQFSGSYDSLPKFYSDVDIVLIASDRDAGPSMFAEASLSNVPSISTKVGFPEYVVEHMRNGLLVDLTEDAFEHAIRVLYFNRELLFMMSKRIRGDYLSKMGNELLMENWRKMFCYMGLY